MDIVNFWQQQVNKWNDEKKCGFCWSFGAPLTLSDLNKQQIDSCCVQVFLTRNNFNQTFSYSPSTSLVNGTNCDEAFELYVLIPSKIGLNNYNEILNHPISESKWETIFRPLKECVSCDVILDFCEILGYNLDIAQWRGEMVFNYQDMNYDGWKINGTFRIKG